MDPVIKRNFVPCEHFIDIRFDQVISADAQNFFHLFSDELFFRFVEPFAVFTVYKLVSLALVDV